MEELAQKTEQNEQLQQEVDALKQKLEETTKANEVLKEQSQQLEQVRGEDWLEQLSTRG